MRETKITAFLLGATILSSMTLSYPSFSGTTDLVDWVGNVNAGTASSNTFNMTEASKNQVLQDSSVWGAMDVYQVTKPGLTLTVDGNTSSGQAINGETIKGSIVYNLSGQTDGGTLIVQNIGDMKQGVDYSNIANVKGDNVAGYIQNLTDYLKNNDTIKDSTGNNIDASGAPAVYTYNANLTAKNNIFYGSSTVGAQDANGTNDLGAGIVASGDSTHEIAVNVSDNTFISNSAQGNGAAVNIEGNSNATVTNNTFVGNSAVNRLGTTAELLGHGGAVDFSGKSLQLSGNRFYQNSAAEAGGALYVHKNSLVTSKGDEFIGNTSGTNGGAVLNTGNLTIDNSTFTSNEAMATNGNGGAVSNDFVVTNLGSNKPVVVESGTLVVKNSEFNKNESMKLGGAVANWTSAVSQNNVYNDNVADYGGAISNAVSESRKDENNNVYQAPKAVLTSEGDTFKDNIAGQHGGAVYNYGYPTVNKEGVATYIPAEAKITNATMVDNTAAYLGGAVYNWGDMEIVGGKYEGNITTKSNGEGGAIYNATGIINLENTQTIAQAKLDVSDATIKGNSSNNSGGGIHNTGILNSTSNTYEQNTSGNGGAITNVANTLPNPLDAQLTSTNDTFQGNKATEKGGAIYNAIGGKAVIEGATFDSNTAATGGAIYNAGTLTINNAATTTFKNNGATNGGSAIYNETGGTVTIQGAKDTIDLDYDPYYSQQTENSGHPAPSQKVRLFADGEDVVNKGTLNISNSSLQLHHSSDLTKGVINIDKSKTGTVNVNNSRIDVGKSAVYGDVINVNAGSEMLVHLNTKDGTKEDLGKNFGGLSANTINVSSDDTAITIRVKAGEHMNKGEGPKEFKILDASTLNVVDNTGFATITKNGMYNIKYKGDGVYELTKIRPICPNGGCVHNAWVESEEDMVGHNRAQEIRDLLNNLAQAPGGCDSKVYKDALDGIAPDVSPLIQAQATEITQRLHGMISKQLYASMDRTGYVHRGKRFYRFPERKSRVWMQSLYGQSEYTGDKGFDMDTEGFAIGFDKHIARDTKLGVAYTFAKSDGTAVQRDTEVESHTVAVYGEYNPDRFYTNWLALYTRSSYEENKKVYTERVKAEYDVDVFGGQIMFGNKMGPFVVGDWASGVLSPEIGLRYTYIKQHGHTDSAGQKVSGADGHVLTGILGAQYTIGYTLSPSIAWYPELRAAITYDFLEPDLENSVTLVNGARYDVVTENLDKFGIEIGARVGLDINRKAEIALEYEGVFKGDYTNHTGLASLKYKF